MSYRLCEAALNGFISDDEFTERFDMLMQTTTSLLEIQLEIAREETKKAKIQLQQLQLTR